MTTNTKLELKGKLQNEFVAISYDLAVKTISGDDLTDNWNRPRFYNRKIQGLKKGVQALVDQFNETTTFYGAIAILDSYKTDIRSYCSMD